MQRTIDLAAIGRVAKHVELKSVRLVAISSNCNATIPGSLEPSVDLECSVEGKTGSTLEVNCRYQFVVQSAQTEVVRADITYRLSYELSGTGDSLDDADLAQFAHANGALHSWPFVREFVFSLTAKMGYPPYTLPVMHFNAKPNSAEKSDVQPTK